jgi:hypothetical protein
MGVLRHRFVILFDEELFNAWIWVDNIARNRDIVSSEGVTLHFRGQKPWGICEIILEIINLNI